MSAIEKTALGLALAANNAITPSLIPAAVRGCGNGMRPYFSTTNIPGGYSYCYRSRHRSMTKFTRFRVAIPVFKILSYFDTLLPLNLDFQLGFEYPYTFGVTGIAARTPITFSGANYISYLTASHRKSSAKVDRLTWPSQRRASRGKALRLQVAYPTLSSRR